MVMLEKREEELLDRLTKKLIAGSKGDLNIAKQSALEGISEVKKLLLNHTESI